VRLLPLCSLALVSVLASGACTSGPDLLAVSLPDLSSADASVQQQVRKRHEAVTAAIDRGAAGDELVRAYGAYGMLLHAAEFYDAAEPAYLNAQTLMPGEPRWPYFLAHLHRSRGDTDRAVEHFTRVLQQRPDDLSTLVWLARLHIDRGQPELAEPLLTTANAKAPRTVAVLAALGQTALARRDHRRAVELLEEALRIDPMAQSVHSPLAMAYRALGEAAKADAHLALWRNTDILVPDPWRLELDLALESALSYELRGVRAMDQKDFATALEMFRKGMALTGERTALGRSLRHKAGTALYLTGNVAGAVAQFEETVRLAPAGGLDEPSAKAHYSLAVPAAADARGDAAIAHFTRALEYNPSYLEARVGLAEALRRAGRLEDALTHYREVVRLNPRAADARLGHAMALARLRRYAEARAWLEESVRAQPDRPELTHALARLLAAAPDAGVRDGGRALELVKQLFERDKTTVLGETMAMALAEVGDFEHAAAVQRGIIAAAERAGLQQDVRRMRANLARYERRQPVRTPWSE
jgi:tetratricopeptide (TPR) repeat protein